MPVYYEEDDEDSVEESFLLDDYLFSLDLEPGADSLSLSSTLPFSPEESSSCTEGMNPVPEVPLSPVVLASPSPPPQSTHVVDRGGGEVISTPAPLVGIYTTILDVIPTTLFILTSAEARRSSIQMPNDLNHEWLSLHSTTSMNRTGHESHVSALPLRNTLMIA
jgi:hypothetical protein